MNIFMDGILLHLDGLCAETTINMLCAELKDLYCPPCDGGRTFNILCPFCAWVKFACCVPGVCSSLAVFACTKCACE